VSFTYLRFKAFPTCGIYQSLRIARDGDEARRPRSTSVIIMDRFPPAVTATTTVSPRGPAPGRPRTLLTSAKRLHQPPFPGFLGYGHHRLGARPLTVTSRTFTQTDANQRTLAEAAASAVAVGRAMPVRRRPNTTGKRARTRQAQPPFVRDDGIELIES
jgi:hypothetical protein